MLSLRRLGERKNDRWLTAFAFLPGGSSLDLRALRAT